MYMYMYIACAILCVPFALLNLPQFWKLGSQRCFHHPPQDAILRTYVSPQCQGIKLAVWFSGLLIYNLRMT